MPTMTTVADTVNVELRRTLIQRVKYLQLKKADTNDLIQKAKQLSLQAIAEPKKVSLIMILNLILHLLRLHHESQQNEVRAWNMYIAFVEREQGRRN